MFSFIYNVYRCNLEGEFKFTFIFFIQNFQIVNFL